MTDDTHCWFAPETGLNAADFTVNGPAILDLAGRMRQAREELAQLPVGRIVEALDKASRFWLDFDQPVVADTIRRISETTGTSKPMVRQAVQHEMESSLGPDLFAAIRNEIGNPEYLDRPTTNPLSGGMTFAVGPGLVGGVVSSNIPALPHLTVMRSLLVKAPCIVKTSMAEPYFLPAYAQSLYHMDPVVGAAVAVVCFGREDEGASRTLLSEIDFLIAYGGGEAMASLREMLGPDKPGLFHGHRLGFGLVDKDGLAHGASSRLPARIAYDVVLFDQEACLAPHMVFVQGDADTVRELAGAIHGQMTLLAGELPHAQKPLSQRMAIRNELDRLAMTGETVFGADAPDEGIVTVEQAADFRPSPLGRFVRLVPVSSLDEALAAVRPLSGLLQNVALEVSPDSRDDLMVRLARLGVSRVCPAGNMGTPSMMWHHDGLPCIASMLRFIDWEG
jgi:hypothetical protein